MKKTKITIKKSDDLEIETIKEYIKEKIETDLQSNPKINLYTLRKNLLIFLKEKFPSYMKESKECFGNSVSCNILYELFEAIDTYNKFGLYDSLNDVIMLSGYAEEIDKKDADLLFKKSKLNSFDLIEILGDLDESITIYFTRKLWKDI